MLYPFDPWHSLRTPSSRQTPLGLSRPSFERYTPVMTGRVADLENAYEVVLSRLALDDQPVVEEYVDARASRGFTRGVVAGLLVAGGIAGALFYLHAKAMK